MPLIDGGRNQANLDRSYAVLEESVAGYRQQVLVAFAEVEDNLANVRTLDDQAQATRDAVASASRALRIAQVRGGGKPLAPTSRVGREVAGPGSV